MIKDKCVVIIFIAVTAFFIFTMLVYAAIPCIIEWYSKVMNYGNTGAIGDTIGGITAPIIGSISIALLTWTLFEQINFNKVQKRASDYDMLMKLRDRVSDLSKSVCISTHPEISNIKTVHKGIVSLQELNKPERFISEEDFDRLRDTITEIIELCLLFFNLEQQSALSRGIKESIRKSTLKSFDEVYCFLKSYTDGKVNISYGITSANAIPEENELFDDKNPETEENEENNKVCNKLEKLLKEMEALRVRFLRH